MQHTIYLIGYGNQIPEAFFQRLREGLPFDKEGWLVIDIRRFRRSWCEAYGPQIEYELKREGHDYIWLPELGDVDDADELRLAMGMMALEQHVRRSQRPIVLLCAERLSTKGHRRAVAEKLANRLDLEIRPL